MIGSGIRYGSAFQTNKMQAQLAGDSLSGNTIHGTNVGIIQLIESMPPLAVR
jgi:hypothetical protein